MSASYIIVDVKVTDPERYDQYKALAPAAVAAAGGEFVVRGGKHATLEGNWRPTRLVVLRFPSYEQARAFYDSTLYEQAREQRAGATEFFNMVVVELPAPPSVPHGANRRTVAAHAAKRVILNARTE